MNLDNGDFNPSPAPLMGFRDCRTRVDSSLRNRVFSGFIRPIWEHGRDCAAQRNLRIFPQRRSVGLPLCELHHQLSGVGRLI